MGNVPVVLETVRNIPAYDAGSVSDPNLDGQRWRLPKALTIYYKANLFDQAGMASLLPPEPPPPVPRLDKRTLPPPMRQALVDLKAEYPALTIHELATICYVQFGRRPGAQTIKLVLAAGPAPSRRERRFPPFAQISDPVQRRLAIIRLHAEGWTPSSIAGYLETSRQTVHTTLKKWVTEQFAGLAPQSHAPPGS